MNVVTKLPLSRLTTTRGDAKRVSDVGAAAIRSLLRVGAVRFVVANIGASIRWVPEAECFDWWKQEVQPHLAEPNRPAPLEDFPGGYAYYASQWDDGSTPFVLLSKAH
jgi:hypothetical protein